MILDKVNIEELTKTIDYSGSEITYDILVGEVLLHIKEVDFEKIVKEVSCIEENDDVIEIRLKSINNRMPYLFFRITYENVVSIYVGTGLGEYLDYELINTWDLLHKFRSTLKDLFYFSLKEHVIYCNNVLIGSDFSIPYEKDGVLEDYNFSKHLGFCFFWKNKSTNFMQYEPWCKK